MSIEFDQKEIILETNYWTVILSQDQTYLGRCVVILKRKCGSLAELTTEELLGFLEVIKKVETAFKKSFGATMFNWSCLMNHAYQKNHPDPQVHWHFRPRYNHKVEFEGEIFEDLVFGHHYIRDTERKLSDNLKHKIIEKIISSF